MNRRSLHVYLALLLMSPLCMAANEGDDSVTQPPVSDEVAVDTFYMDKDIVSGRLTMGAETNAGYIGVVFDRATDAVYVNANGMQSSYSISTIANTYYSDSPTKAASMASSLRSYLSSEAGLAAYRMASNDFLGRGGDINSIGGPKLGGACALSPCGPQWGNGYGTNYWGVHYAPNRNPALDGFSPAVIDFDRKNFEAERKRDCDNAKKTAMSMGFKVGATFVGCGSGVGVVACALGLGALGKDVADEINSDSCGQPYPGPGRWKP